VKTKILWAKKTSFLIPCPSTLGQLQPHGCMRSSSKNTGKMSLIPIFNKNSPRAHMESELDVLGVHKKLVKYVVHSCKRKNGKNIFFFTQAAQTTIN
jgi:hypothetical protein